MKNLLTLIICTLLFTSCKVTKEYKHPFTEFQTKLAHRYDAKSNANPNSQFKPVKRIIEFEYEITQPDSLVNILMMVTSGFNEGELIDHLLIHLKNEESLKVSYQSKNAREYVETYSHSYTTPVNKTSTVTDPGGTDIVTQADGTVKHVHRAPSTKFVNSTEQVGQTNNGSKSQLFNSGKLQLQKSQVEQIRLYGIQNFEVILQNSKLILELKNIQSLELKNYLLQ